MSPEPAPPQPDAAAPTRAPARTPDAATGTGGVRFRYSGAVLAAALVGLIAAVPLATAAPWLLPILLVPAVVAVWAWRAGTVADTGGITVTALLGRRRVAWDDVAAIGPRGSRTTVAQLTSGQLLTLPAVRPADIPRLLAAAGPDRRPA